MLEFSDVVCFGALAIFVAVASDDMHAWLERWSGEVANLALVAIAVGSILIRQPHLDWQLDDPKGLPVDEVRAIRDDIARRVVALVDELG